MSLKNLVFQLFLVALYLSSLQAAPNPFVIGIESPGSGKISLNQDLPYRGYSFEVRNLNHSYNFTDVNQVAISNLSIKFTDSCPQFTRTFVQGPDQYLIYSWCNGTLQENTCSFSNTKLALSCSNSTIFTNFPKPNNLIYLSNIYMILLNGSNSSTQDLVISYSRISNEVFRVNNPTTDPVSKSLMQMLNGQVLVVASLHKSTSTIRLYNVGIDGRPIGNLSYTSPSQTIHSGQFGFIRFDDMTLFQNSREEVYLFVRSGWNVAALNVSLKSCDLMSVFNVTNQDQVYIFGYENMLVAMDPMSNLYAQVNLTEVTRPSTIQVISPPNCNMTTSLKYVRQTSVNLMLFLCIPMPFANGTVDANDYIYVFDVNQPSTSNLRTAIPVPRALTQKRSFFYATAAIANDSLLLAFPQNDGGMIGYQIHYSPALAVNISQDEYCDPNNLIPRPGACPISFTISGNPIVSNLAGNFSQPYLGIATLYRLFTVRPPKATQKFMKSAETTKGKAIFPITGIFNGTLFNTTFSTDFFKFETQYPICEVSSYRFNISLSDAIDLSYSDGYASILFPQYFVSYQRNESTSGWSLITQQDLNPLNCSEIYSLGPMARMYTLVRCVDTNNTSWLYYLSGEGAGIVPFIKMQNSLIAYSRSRSMLAVAPKTLPENPDFVSFYSFSTGISNQPLFTIPSKSLGVKGELLAIHMDSGVADDDGTTYYEVIAITADGNVIFCSSSADGKHSACCTRKWDFVTNLGVFGSVQITKIYLHSERSVFYITTKNSYSFRGKISRSGEMGKIETCKLSLKNGFAYYSGYTNIGRFSDTDGDTSYVIQRTPEFKCVLSVYPYFVPNETSNCFTPYLLSETDTWVKNDVAICEAMVIQEVECPIPFSSPLYFTSGNSTNYFTETAWVNYTIGTTYELSLGTEIAVPELTFTVNASNSFAYALIDWKFYRDLNNTLLAQLIWGVSGVWLAYFAWVLWSGEKWRHQLRAEFRRVRCKFSRTLGQGVRFYQASIFFIALLLLAIQSNK